LFLELIRVTKWMGQSADLRVTKGVRGEDQGEHGPGSTR
jgi:hypothetical protein